MSTLGQKFRNIGPGALVAAAFIGPGTVTTCSVSGASYGYVMLWALLFATIATIIFQEMAARIGIATGKGLGENVRDGISNAALKWIAIILIIVALFIGNVAYETGNITGGILGIQAVFPDTNMQFIVVIIVLLAGGLLLSGNYKVIQNILTAIVVVMGVVFIVTAFASKPDWGEIAKGMFVPSLPENDMKGILVAVGLIGTTVVPYNLFLHASSAAQRWKDPEQVGDARFDAVLSIGLGGIISMCILVCAAANIYGTGVEIASGKDMALALSTPLGGWATWLFAIGLLAAGFTSAITAPLAAAYAVSGALGWGDDMKSGRFRAIWMTVMLCGAVMAIWLGKSPTQLILVAQAANAIILPIMAFFVIYCANKSNMDALRNHLFANIFGVVIIIVTLFICYRNLTSFAASLMKLVNGS